MRSASGSARWTYGKKVAPSRSWERPRGAPRASTARSHGRRRPIPSGFKRSLIQAKGTWRGFEFRFMVRNRMKPVGFSKAGQVGRSLGSADGSQRGIKRVRPTGEARHTLRHTPSVTPKKSHQVATEPAFTKTRGKALRLGRSRRRQQHGALQGGAAGQRPTTARRGLPPATTVGTSREDGEATPSPEPSAGGSANAPLDADDAPSGPPSAGTGPRSHTRSA